MSIDNEARYHVAIIGAGPAGLFAARQLADRNIKTVLINRDIKPGGLAEYGIYPSKTKMKDGLRNQFRQILAMSEIEYYGNVLVGDHADLSLQELRAMGFHAVLVTVGAQGTKHLGIPGEHLPGVYHAKDIVYHYNLLPPFSEQTYQIGKRVAVIGVGNVMMDIARWLIEDKGAERVTAVARRGPAEVKFDKKELENLVAYVNLKALDEELERVRPVMEAIGQQPGELRELIHETGKKVPALSENDCFYMHFLASPASVLSDDQGRVTGLEVEENVLSVGQDGETRARGTGKRHVLDVDTVIFAIGDQVDNAFGLPVQNGEYVKNPQPRFPIDGISYEAFDPETGQVIPDVFLAGWARRASTGLVGVARKDATNASQAVIQYLQTLSPSESPVMEQLREHLSALPHPVIDKPALLRLDAFERDRARQLGVEAFKFGSNIAMLEALGMPS